MGLQTLFQYVIDGLGDSPANKTMQCSATTMKDFKQRLKTYVRIRSSNRARTKSEEKRRNDDVVTQKRVNRWCLNCSLQGNFFRECMSKSQSIKCFNCNAFGHISKNCKRKVSWSKMTTIVKKNSGKMMKTIKIIGHALKCFVDIGSKVSYLGYAIYKEIHPYQINVKSF